VFERHIIDVSVNFELRYWVTIFTTYNGTLFIILRKEYIVEICDLLGYYTVCSGNYLPNFQEKSVPKRR